MGKRWKIQLHFVIFVFQYINLKKGKNEKKSQKFFKRVFSKNPIVQFIIFETMNR